jgi:two-component SAPR family response regulator
MSNGNAYSSMNTIARFPSDSDRGTPHRSSDAAGKPSTILVVEDNEMVCALVHEILVSDGYIVLSAYHSAEALDIVTSYCGSLELLLTDIVLPRISGKQLSDSAVALRPGLKTLYMSGYPEYSLESFGWPSIPYIQKPFTVEYLMKRVRSILSTNLQGYEISDSAAGHTQTMIAQHRNHLPHASNRQNGGRCDEGSGH